MKTIQGLIITAFAAIALLPVAAMAQTQDTKNQGYLQDKDSGFVANGTGLCWHTSDWTPARAMAPCDPTLGKAPVIVAAATPTPAPSPTPVAASSQKISFSGDALFAFDKSALKPDGKLMLDGLVQQARGASYDTILATGHTDRLGKSAYNQKLSERRAQAVKDYLVSQNIQAGRIDAQGKGETQPVTKPGDCRSAKTAKLIACLQPDRRVDIEMTGSKAASQ